MVPIRCFTCGAVIGNKWEAFSKRVKTGEEPGKVLDSLGITRYCCRRMLLSHVDVINETLRFYEAAEKKRREAV